MSEEWTKQLALTEAINIRDHVSRHSEWPWTLGAAMFVLQSLDANDLNQKFRGIEPVFADTLCDRIPWLTHERRVALFRAHVRLLARLGEAVGFVHVTPCSSARSELPADFVRQCAGSNDVDMMVVAYESRYAPTSVWMAEMTESGLGPWYTVPEPDSGEWVDPILPYTWPAASGQGKPWNEQEMDEETDKVMLFILCGADSLCEISPMAVFFGTEDTSTHLPRKQATSLHATDIFDSSRTDQQNMDLFRRALIAGVQAMSADGVVYVMPARRSPNGAAEKQMCAITIRETLKGAPRGWLACVEDNRMGEWKQLSPEETAHWSMHILPEQN